VSQNYDPIRFEPNRYVAFLDALCGDREYQKEAIVETTRYLLGGQYRSLWDLAKENYGNNKTLLEKYASMEELKRNLQLPDKLACSLDLATATGKSYVMAGIARILLAGGAVDQVLILCPSNTIESGLMEKFRVLSTDRTLKNLLPENSTTTNPRVINASNTIQKGDICIENIHATYLRTRSAIEDSLAGKGDRTLVLNDEAHHLMSPSDTALKKWKEFLIEPKYGFRYIVNLSGTCYVGDEYFSDVIYRYSIRQAIEDRVVKTIRYVAEDTSSNEQEKFQKIYDNHSENKNVRYRLVKPITIMVTKDIASCKSLNDKLATFLSKREKIGREVAEQKVLVVTSASEHKKNIPLLRRVDDRENPIEWITSVSMLSEGWDVKNVFQIVPHEERAFNSKLLIAQVLGRGLRIPEAYKESQPVVTVFNHDKWSTGIRHLVDEILEIEKRIHSYPIDKKEDYHFDLWNIDYLREEREIASAQEDQYQLLKKGYVAYASQVPELERTTTYARVLSGEQDVKKTRIELRMYTVDEAVNEVVNKLRSIDLDLESNYSQDFPRDKVKDVILESLRRVGVNKEIVSEANLNKTLQAFGVVYRKQSKSVRLEVVPEKLVKVSTREIRKSSLGVSNLRKVATVFFDDYSISSGEEADRSLLKELEDDESLPKSALSKVNNKYNFKTPLNVCLASHAPERKFVRGLTSDDTTKIVDSWVKSPDVGFYEIEFSWRKGEHPKQGTFNPDFFIRIGGDILVIEIKDDNEASIESKAKLRFANDHFARINALQSEQKYHFKFLSPSSYDLFFDAVKKREYGDFKSELEARLEE
jgi:type III restriction enzyme